MRRRGEGDAGIVRARAVGRQAVRAAEDMVSSAWLLHLVDLEREVETALRAARHLREEARAELRAAQRSEKRQRIAEAQRGLADARHDFGECFEIHRRVRALARRESESFAAASNERASGALADQARIEALTPTAPRKGHE